MTAPKRRAAVIALTGAVIVAGAVWLLATPQAEPRSASPSSEARTPTAPLFAPSSAGAPRTRSPAAGRGPAMAADPAQPRSAPPATRLSPAGRRVAPAPTVRLRGDALVATVDGVAITGTDLGVAREREMSQERYAFLRHAAVEHALVRRAADAAGVTLDGARERALEELRARSLEADPRVGDSLGLRPEAVEHDLRSFETAMRLEALGEARGVPSRDVTAEQVRDYYAEHEAELGPLPIDPAARAQAWRDVEIAVRQALAREVAGRHDEGLAALRASLWAAATVELAPTP